MKPALAAALLVLGTTCAAAGDLERALQLMEEDFPKTCEIRTLQAKARRAPPESRERKALADRLYETAVQFERENRARQQEMEAILGRLPRQDREKVIQRSMALAEKCLAPLGPEPEPEPPSLPSGSAMPPQQPAAIKVERAPVPQAAPSSPGSQGERGYAK